MAAKFDTTQLPTDIRAAYNMGLNEMAGEVVNQTACFYQTFVLSVIVVLLNRHFVKPRNVVSNPSATCKPTQN